MGWWRGSVGRGGKGDVILLASDVITLMLFRHFTCVYMYTLGIK